MKVLSRLFNVVLIIFIVYQSLYGVHLISKLDYAYYLVVIVGAFASIVAYVLYLFKGYFKDTSTNFAVLYALILSVWIGAVLEGIFGILFNGLILLIIGSIYDEIRIVIRRLVPIEYHRSGIILLVQRLIFNVLFNVATFGLWVPFVYYGYSKYMYGDFFDYVILALFPCVILYVNINLIPEFEKYLDNPSRYVLNL